ncbi:Os11g0104150, partial [Oryza sativa Japonica Group]
GWQTWSEEGMMYAVARRSCSYDGNCEQDRPSNPFFFP